jgi:ABC-type xylose transport system permease subunit
MKGFITKVLIAGASLALIGWLAFGWFVPEYYLPVLPYTLLLFVVITIVVHAWQLNLAKKDLAKFARYGMLITFLKLVIYTIFAVVYIANNTDNVITFVIVLMVLYVVFTFLEVKELMRVTKKK